MRKFKLKIGRMRSIKWVSAILILTIILSACVEIQPIVTGVEEQIEPPVNIKEQKRQVLIEEFTGVRCVNCPAGSAAIEDLKKVHGAQLVVVSIHAGDFSPPYPQSKYDFRTHEGNLLLDFLEKPFSYPTAIVNRKKFDGQFGLQLGSGSWAGFINTEKQLEPKVKIDLKTSYNSGTRNLTLTSTIFVQENISLASVKLSVMVVENNIVDLQLAPGSSTPKVDYVHKHVLRKMLTPFDGEPLAFPLRARDVITKSFEYKLPPDWKEADCSVIAFVHFGASEKTVLQAHEKKVIE